MYITGGSGVTCTIDDVTIDTAVCGGSGGAFYINDYLMTITTF
jgi:hypothetical protein